MMQSPATVQGLSPHSDADEPNRSVLVVLQSQRNASLLANFSSAFLFLLIMLRSVTNFQIGEVGNAGRAVPHSPEGDHR